MSGRKAPEDHAKDFAIGTERRGLDGNTWKVVKISNGVKRWQKVSDNAGSAKSSVKSKAKTPVKQKKVTPKKQPTRKQEKREKDEEIIVDEGTVYFSHDYMFENNKKASYYIYADKVTKRFLTIFDKFGFTIYELRGENKKEIYNSRKYEGFWDGRMEDAGSNVLVKLSKTKYMLVGANIFSFTTKDEIFDFAVPEVKYNNGIIGYEPISLGYNTIYFLEDLSKIKSGCLSRNSYFTFDELNKEFYSLKGCEIKPIEPEDIVYTERSGVRSRSTSRSANRDRERTMKTDKEYHYGPRDERVMMIHTFYSGSNPRDFDYKYDPTPKFSDIEDQIGDDYVRGDLVEDLSLSGYRSDGVYMIDVVNNKPKIIKLDYNLNSEGTVNVKFKVISDFPAYYWDYSRFDKYHPDVEYKSYWHGGNDRRPLGMYIDPIVLDLENKMVFDSEDEHYIYYIFRYDGDEYIILISKNYYKSKRAVFNKYRSLSNKYMMIGKPDYRVASKYNPDRSYELHTISF